MIVPKEKQKLGKNMSNVNTDLIHQLNGFITVKEKKEYTQHYDRILSYFMNEMKTKDELFKLMYNGFKLSGSYASNLKVSKPNEFDTIIILKLVKNNFNVRVSFKTLTWIITYIFCIQVT